ncbi:RNA polymerase sigma factor SigZ [Emticicia aquatilis]|uniref:RNA polymerase sigma factor SigZ n=1 Tax=Emticicia aquatilis TaxID=1537369 RepID=A0A917DWF2_9BACT|nr:sigma-70 family RNA polymerase sigma factor [Emticicia aquatilis]GGD76725.1 RNA polymerase sigma factor SigZ [Emticicia aquatilis]
MNKVVEEIWIDLHQELKNFIRNKVKNIDDSNDILQEVFLKIHLNIHRLNDYTKLTSWVYQITRNAIADHFRENKPSFQIEDLDFPEQAYEEPLYQALSSCINLKISLLPEKYKKSILLTSFQNFSQIELAENLNISHSGAKSRVQRAKNQLKSLILDCKNVETDTNDNIIGYKSPSEFI